MPVDTIETLQSFLHDSTSSSDAPSFDAADHTAAVARTFAALVERGLDRLPLPAHGDTRGRWRALATVAACDLALVKLYEGHTDALAILAELESDAIVRGARWGVWAAEPPDARLVATRVATTGALRVDGKKAWCSGAQAVTHALATAWLDDGPILVAVALDAPGVTIDPDGWRAVGMAASATCDVRFDGVRAAMVGGPQAYLRRPGFWHGGAGIAACWYGAAAMLRDTLTGALARRSHAHADPHALAHLGAADVALAGAACVLRETATWIDAHPHADAQLPALRARLAVEQAATATLSHVARALGPAPFCRDRRFARLMADLPVFLRQSHAERDLAALGEATLSEGGTAWTL